MDQTPGNNQIYYIVSDLHLMDRNQEFLFNFEKENAFCSLAQTALKENAFLVLNGDIFDFTGMTPCQNGVKEFFDETVPKEKQIPELIEQNFKFRTTRELLEDIQKTFPKFFESLAALANKKRLIYVPGNHDCDFLSSNSRADLARILNVDFQNIQWTKQFLIGRNLVVTHGNQYDPPNETEKSCKNPGFVFTSALYTAVLPALQMLGIEDEVIAAIPAVRPEENVIKGLEHYLTDEQLQNVLLALTKLLIRNGYFRGIRAIPGWFLTREIPLISKMFQKKVTAGRVLALLPKDEKLMTDARAGARKLFLQLRKENLITEQAVIALGHTHELDRADNYVNLGTWLDHLRGLTRDEISSPEISLPVLKFSGAGQSEIVEFKNLLGHSDVNQAPHLST